LKQQVIVLTNPLCTSGGCLHALRTLKAYSEAFNVHAYLISTIIQNTDFLHVQKILTELINANINVAGYYARFHELSFSRTLRLQYVLPSFIAIRNLKFKLFSHIEFSVAISLHENVEVLLAVFALAKTFEAKTMAILQLPPFYGSKKRLRNILKAISLWYHVTCGELEKCNVKTRFYKRKPKYEILARKAKDLLRKFDKIVAVSKMKRGVQAYC